MNETAAIEIARQRAKDLGLKGCWSIEPFYVRMATKTTLFYRADNELWFLVDFPNLLTIQADNACFSTVAAKIQENNVAEFNGAIRIRNESDLAQTLLFYRLIY